MANTLSEHDLIQLISTFPVLYDKSSARGSKNAQKKDAAWRVVSQQMNASERACITRWKSIRDRFGKEYRRLLEFPEEPVTWDLFPQLMFLKDHYKHGNAKNDELPQIIYEPRVKRKIREAHNEDETNNCDEIEDDEARFANQRLIQLVKMHEVIYDKQKIRDSKNLTAKNDAWREISEKMGISEEVCYKRWKKLRDRFSRECRQHHIVPNEAVEWEYFEDLQFLESHYRKGIPLNVKELKRPGRPRKTERQAVKRICSVDENVWSNEETTFDYAILEQNIPEESQEYKFAKNGSYLEFSNDMDCEDIGNIEQVEDSFQAPGAEVKHKEPVAQLCSVIDNIEALLQQSQVCLQSLREQQEKHRKELNGALGSSYSSSRSSRLIQKMDVLLDGLSDDNRAKAEVKIIKFLCECQIKTLNNEDIDDLRKSNVY